MSVLTLESLAEAFAKKDAEIERLKGELVKAFSDITYQRTLITELCDAIERVNYSWPNDYDADLLLRAREATRCQP